MDRISKEEAYEVLGLDGEGEKSEEDIRRAYKKKSLATHPDKNPVSLIIACFFLRRLYGALSLSLPLSS